MASEAFFMLSSGPEEFEISLETKQMTPVQNTNSNHQQNTEKLSSCSASPTKCYEPASQDFARHQCSDIDLKLLEDKLKHGELITKTNNLYYIPSTTKVFYDDAPPAEWASKLPEHALPSSELIHHLNQMSDHTISHTKGFRFVQLNKSIPKTQSQTTTITRVACIPKGCPKGTSKTTESINQAPKPSDTKSDVVFPVIPVGAMSTPPSAGDAAECEVTSQTTAARHGSTRRRRRGSRKVGSTKKPPKMMGQSGDHEQAAFAEAFPPAARTLNIQWLGRSEKGWKDIEATVRCHRLKEERLILRLLRLERLQHLTIEAERKRPSSANPVKPRPKPNEVLGPWPYRQSNDQADRKTKASAASSRPVSAYSCCDATTIHLQRKSALADAADRKCAVDGLSRCIRELNTGDRAVPGGSLPNGRYAWLSAVESKTLTTTLPWQQ